MSEDPDTAYLAMHEKKKDTTAPNTTEAMSSTLAPAAVPAATTAAAAAAAAATSTTVKSKPAKTATAFIAPVAITAFAKSTIKLAKTEATKTEPDDNAKPPTDVVKVSVAKFLTMQVHTMTLVRIMMNQSLEKSHVQHVEEQLCELSPDQVQKDQKQNGDKKKKKLYLKQMKPDAAGFALALSAKTYARQVHGNLIDCLVVCPPAFIRYSSLIGFCLEGLAVAGIADVKLDDLREDARTRGAEQFFDDFDAKTQIDMPLSVFFAMQRRVMALASTYGQHVLDGSENDASERQRLQMLSLVALEYAREVYDDLNALFLSHPHVPKSLYKQFKDTLAEFEMTLELD